MYDTEKKLHPFFEDQIHSWSLARAENDNGKMTVYLTCNSSARVRQLLILLHTPPGILPRGSRTNPVPILVTAEYWTSENYRHCMLHPTAHQQNRLCPALCKSRLMRNSHYQTIIDPDPSLFSTSFRTIIGAIATFTEV
jgi:hypothetical protein